MGKYSLKHILSIACAALFVLQSAQALAAPPTVIADRDRIVVMISIDGLANFYMDDSAAEMPTIRKLAAEGARAASMRASDPTVTWSNHTTLVTGVSPAKHGVISNNYYDRVKGEKVTLIWDPVFDKDEVVKVPTLYDLAKAAGLKTAGVRWPVTRNAHALDWNAPDLGKLELVEKYTTPALVAECKDASLDVLIGNEGKTLSLGESIEQDETWTRVFNLILQRHRPNVGLLHVVAVDHTEHIDGPRSDEAYQSIKAADGQVRQVLEELQKDFPGKATLFVVSDHGFSANRTKLSANDVLEKAGLVETRNGHATGGSVRVVPQGGSAFVYVIDEGRRDEIVKKVKKAFAHADGVDKVLTTDDYPEYGIADPRRDPRAPDLVLEAKYGCYFWRYGRRIEDGAQRKPRARLPYARASCDICRLGAGDQARRQARRDRQPERGADDREALGRRDSRCGRQAAYGCACRMTALWP